MFQSDIEELPASTMDGHFVFDVARLMCIERGGGIVQELGGPFLEVTLYDDDGGDDGDDGDTKRYKHYHMDRLIVVSYLVFINTS